MSKVGDVNAAAEEKAKMLGDPYKHDPNFKGPIKNRSCTDCICLIIYCIFALASVAVAVFSFARGNPSLLMYPTDSQGRVCGYSDMASKPNLMYYDLLQCVRNLPALLATGCPTTQQCVATCPSTTWAWLTLQATELALGVDASRRKSQMQCLDQVDFTQSKWSEYQLASLIQDGYCAPYLLPEKPVVYRCMPAFLVDAANGMANLNQTLYDSSGNIVTETALTASKQVYSAVMEIQSWGERALADIRSSWPHMCVLCGFALIIAFLWIVLLRFFAGVIIWTTIILFMLMWLFGVAFCFWRYNLLAKVVNITPPSEISALTNAISFQTNFDSSDLWLGVGIVCAVILLVCIIVLAFLGSRIRLAVCLFEETSRALGHMPSVLFWPLIPFAIQLGTIGWAVACALCLATLGRAQFVSSSNSSTYSGLITLPDSITSCDYTSVMSAAIQATSSVAGSDASAAATAATASGISAVNTTLAEACRFLKYGAAEYAIYFQIFNVFMFFWNYNFVAGFGICCLAASFASYYWAFEKPADIPAFPLARGIWTTIRYHLGSIAFGSLLIAIVQVIRIILDYIRYKLKKQKNHVVACLVKCFDCCFSCIEKLVKYIARKAYIMIAVHGKNFCASAFAGWQLLMRNPLRAIVLSGVSRFLIILSKLIVTGGMIVLAYFYFHGEIPGSLPILVDTWPVLNYFYVPVIIVSIGAFAVSSVCFHVYEIGVETVFLAFLEDCERNDGSAEKPYFMSKKLAAAMR